MMIFIMYNVIIISYYLMLHIPQDAVLRKTNLSLLHHTCCTEITGGAP